MTSRADVARDVADRAEGRCEYCRMHQALQGATFHIEHIVPQSKGGRSEADNYAWCCPSCNLHKADRIAVTIEGKSVRLFHPRGDRWADHFEWHGVELVGKSDIGRATIHALVLNHPRRLAIRRAESLFGLFPP